VELPGRKAAQKSKAKVKNEWRYKSAPPYALMKYTLSVYLYVYGISYVL
jgi:hypothetical protein